MYIVHHMYICNTVYTEHIVHVVYYVVYVVYVCRASGVCDAVYVELIYVHSAPYVHM